MFFDWRSRAAIERRMARPVFRALSRALGRAVLDGSIAPLVATSAHWRASDADVLLAARCQGVAGHLRPMLADAPASWSAATIDALHVEADRIAERSMRLRDDLATLAHAAEAEDLRWSPLKGTWLRIGVDDHPERRPSADIDLLVEPADQARWDALLRRMGYVPVHVERHASYLRPGAPVADAAGDHPDHPRPVELHTRLHEVVFGVPRDVTTAYRAGLVPSRVQGMKLDMPSPDGLALHLVLHGAAAMVSRGLRISQLLDLRAIADHEATRVALQTFLPRETWATAALAERDLPGLVPAALRAVTVDGGAGAAWRRAVLSRPGVLEGDPLRWRTALGEWRLAGSRHVVRRLREAVAGRTALASDGQATVAAVAGTHLRSALDRITGPRSRGASGE